MTSVVLESLSFFPMAGLKVASFVFFYILIVQKKLNIFIKVS